MHTLRFSKTCLLSLNERRGFSVSFGEQATIIRAGNGFGKSALLKSLYDTFGAQPHKIDDAWRSARVASLVHFTVNGDRYTALKAAGFYTIFDADKRQLIRTNQVGRELSVFLADLLDFRLTATNRSEETIVPPPSYIFAPFYVDQDKSWNSAWASFRDLYLPNSARLITEYHSGLRPNEYYLALADRDKAQRELKSLEQERKSLEHAVSRVRKIAEDVELHYDLGQFRKEIDLLVKESGLLNSAQLAYRKKVSDLNEERLLWREQADLVRATLAETKASLIAAVHHPHEVHCPTCGQEYENSIAEQFALVEEEDGLIASLLLADEKIRNLDERIASERERLSELEGQVDRIEEILASKKALISFRDVVAAEGRNETARHLQEDIDNIDERITDKLKLVVEAKRKMKEAVDPKRSKEINSFFATTLARFSQRLNVRLSDESSKISSAASGRGSEGPRGLLSYNYAFLQTIQKYSSAVFCPIVIDAPNQQGQDSEHLPMMLDFILDMRPSNRQIIVGVESSFNVGPDRAKIIDLEGKRNQLLLEDEFQSVSDEFRPFLEQLI